MTESHKNSVQSAPLNTLLWLFIIACILTAAAVATSSTNFRINKDTLIPLITFPNDSTDKVTNWEVVGDIENINFNNTRPIIWSNKPNRTVVKTLQQFDRDKNRDNSFLLVNVSISRADLPYGLETNNKFGSLASAIVVQSNTESNEKYFQEHLFKILDLERQTQSWTTVTSIDSHTSWFKIQMLLQTPGAWTLDRLHISSVSLSTNYIAALVPLVLLWGVFWFFLLKHMAKQLERGEHWWLRLIALAAIVLMMLGAVLSRTVFSPLRSILVSANEIIAMDLTLHIIAHFVFSIIVLMFQRISWQLICNVFLLNLIIAMFIESAQAHLPHRSANIEDLVYGMAGAATAIFIGLVIWQVHTLYAKLKP